MEKEENVVEVSRSRSLVGKIAGFITDKAISFIESQEAEIQELNRQAQINQTDATVARIPE